LGHSPGPGAGLPGYLAGFASQPGFHISLGSERLDRLTQLLAGDLYFLSQCLLGRREILRRTSIGGRESF
jgi:hypothetical protein